ncbi:transcription elongation factor GreA [Candidatus Fukatsuia anoeciicola]|uniref:transcription elongation factor GreA n=1 Tax=Candidatus Fukatsuia anoeciicola TaxID=2994492 RepID=UPI00346399A5
MKQVPMTVYGADKLNKELTYLKNIRRPEITTAIADARMHGDLKENAEYHAAREQQSFCEGRIKEIETKLSHATIIDITKITPTGGVIFGVTVTVYNIDTNKTLVYRIVGDDEADLKQNLISVSSPIARGLMSKKINDKVIITTPGGKVTYQILKVEHL